MILKRLTAACAVMISAISCADISDLEDRLDSLESRVKAIENIIPSLNNNIEALQALTEGTTINSVENLGDKYKITLTNGEVLYITQGSIGIAAAPLMSVDKDGYWMVDYQDGYGPVHVLKEGEKVKAVGDNGILPEFGVDKEGFWTVSYDEGMTWVQVTGTDGKPVSALPENSADEFFADVILNDEVLVLTLHNGEKISVPVVHDFLFKINAPDAVQTIAPGQTKAYTIESKGVASASVIARPEGFQVILTDTHIYVKAEALTKASANTQTDVAVLAISEKGFAAISKVRVQMEGAETDPDIPNVEPDQPETPVDPDKPVDPENPEPEDPDKPVEPEIPADQGLYSLYLAGEDVDIAGLTINKETYGEAVLITENSENKVIESRGVYFIDPKAAGVSIKADAECLVIISNDDETATVSRSGQTALNATSGTDCFIMSNIKYVTSQTTGNVIGAKGDGVFENVVLHNCSIEVPKDMNLFYSPKAIANFNITDCDIRLHDGSGDKYIFQSSITTTYDTVVFKNNVIYCTDGNTMNFRFFTNGNGTISSLTFDNNTVAGVYAKATYGYVTVKSIKSGTASNNLFYVPQYSSLVQDKYTGIVHIADKEESGLEMLYNLAYYADEKLPAQRIKCSYYSSNGTIYSKCNQDNPIISPDYANGIFTQSETYKTYGAKR